MGHASANDIAQQQGRLIPEGVLRYYSGRLVFEWFGSILRDCYLRHDGRMCKA